MSKQQSPAQLYAAGAEWFTENRGGFTLDDHAAVCCPFRPEPTPEWESWMEWSQWTAEKRVREGFWARLPDGRYWVLGIKESEVRK